MNLPADGRATRADILFMFFYFLQPHKDFNKQVGPCVWKAKSATQEVVLMALKSLVREVFIGSNQTCPARDASDFVQCFT